MRPGPVAAPSGGPAAPGAHRGSAAAAAGHGYGAPYFRRPAAESSGGAASGYGGGGGGCSGNVGVASGGTGHVGFGSKIGGGKPQATFAVMTDAELALLKLPYGDDEAFGERLNQVLEEHGVAVVTGILDPEEISQFESLKKHESRTESAQPGHMLHCQGEIAWQARLHPRVRGTFARIFGVEPTALATSCDLTSKFYSEDQDQAPVLDQWLHVDQNTLTGLEHCCFQSALYIRASGDASSTTVVWPGSHREAYERFVADPSAAEKKDKVDGSGVKFGHYLEINNFLDKDSGNTLLDEALRGSKRVPVPAGSLLLWSSKTTHQGWQGGARFAVPVCWEPRSRVDEGATARKLFMAAAGIASSHSPSEGRLHPFASRRRGAAMRRPAARPWTVRPDIPRADWDTLWESWPGEACAEDIMGAVDAKLLAAALRGEVVGAL